MLRRTWVALTMFVAIAFGGCAYGEAATKPIPIANDGGVDAKATIMSVRNPAADNHPALGASVTVAGVVTDVKNVGNSHGFFLQDPSSSEWAAIYVFVAGANVDVRMGDVVRVAGTYESYIGLDELDATSGSVTKTGVAARPTPLEVALRDIEEGGVRPLALQSMLLRVRNVVAMTDTNGREFTVGEYDSAATLTVTSYVANDVGPSPFPATAGQTFSSIIGHGYAYGVAQLAPATADDVASP